jgi:hypothetical protein
LQELVRSGRGSVPIYSAPGTTIPGYMYYYNDTTIKLVELPAGAGGGFDTVRVPRQRLMLSGNAVATAGCSYRFPVGPQNLDYRLGFIYLGKFYGCVNGSWGGALGRLSESAGWDRAQWSNWLSNSTITSAGLELRLAAHTFSTYPLAVSARWDRGLTYPLPLGGDRYTLAIGFSFDNWETVSDPLNGVRRY